MSKKRVNYAELRAGRGLVRGLDTAFDEACERNGVPIEAIKRLVTPIAVSTWDTVAKCILADWQSEQPTPTVIVPDLAPAELAAWAEKKIGLTYLSPDFKTWNFCQYRVAEGETERFLEVREKRYEALTWKPGKDVTTQQVRDHFERLKADGNTAAFIAWIAETKPEGYYCSISSDDTLLFRNSDASLDAPCFSWDGACCSLGLGEVGEDWDDDCVFVAFRVISS